MQEVIAHRGKTNRNAECTPGYYNFEGEFNRRQDGNYNGGFPAYIGHMSAVRERDGAALHLHLRSPGARPAPATVAFRRPIARPSTTVGGDLCP